jgi:hypothetical protein
VARRWQLDEIFVLETERVLGGAWVIRFDGRMRLAELLRGCYRGARR